MRHPEIKSEEALELGKDFSFEVIYDTWPAIELGPYLGLEIDQPAWEITDEDLGRELKGIQEQNALFTDKESGVVEKGNIVNIDYVELDEARRGASPGTKREAFVFEVGTGYNVYKMDDDIVGHEEGRDEDHHQDLPRGLRDKGPGGKDGDPPGHAEQHARRRSSRRSTTSWRRTSARSSRPWTI